MQLYIKQKIFSLTDHYDIFDENNQAIFSVEREFLSLGAKVHVYDINGQERFYMKQKLMTFLPQYEIYKDDYLCAVINKELTLFKPRLNITSEYGDFTIEGSVWNMDFEIAHNGQVLGTVCKEWFTWGDTYVLNIEDHQDPAFFCTMVIAIDHCLHSGQNK